MTERDSLLYMILCRGCTYWRVIWFVYLSACFNLASCVHLKELNQFGFLFQSGLFYFITFYSILSNDHSSRFEMPYNIWCGGCNSMIAKGVRFNAEKKQVGNYYSTKVC